MQVHIVLSDYFEGDFSMLQENFGYMSASGERKFIDSWSAALTHVSSLSIHMAPKGEASYEVASSAPLYRAAFLDAYPDLIAFAEGVDWIHELADDFVTPGLLTISCY